jgi:hypothetical protein
MPPGPCRCQRSARCARRSWPPWCSPGRHGGAVAGLGHGRDVRIRPASWVGELELRAGAGMRGPRRGGAGKHGTRSERSRPSSATRRSLSRKASRARSYRRRRRPGCLGHGLSTAPSPRAGRRRHGAGRRSPWSHRHRDEADRVQHRGPAGAAGYSAATTEYGQPGIIRARPSPLVDVAEEPLRAGHRVGPQPRAHLRGQHDPPIGGPGVAARLIVTAAAGDIDPGPAFSASCKRCGRAGVAAPARQPSQGLHWPSAHSTGATETVIGSPGSAGAPAAAYFTIRNRRALATRARAPVTLIL